MTDTVIEDVKFGKVMAMDINELQEEYSNKYIDLIDRATSPLSN